MKPVLFGAIVSLCATAAFATSEHGVHGDWETLSDSTGCVAWTVSNEGPDAQIWFRDLPGREPFMELRGATWLEQPASSPFWDRSKSGEIVNIGLSGSPWVQIAMVRYEGDRNIVPSIDTESTGVIASILRMGEDKGLDVIVRRDYARVGRFSSNGYGAAMKRLEACKLTLGQGF